MLHKDEAEIAAKIVIAALQSGKLVPEARIIVSLYKTVYKDTTCIRPNI